MAKPIQKNDINFYESYKNSKKHGFSTDKLTLAAVAGVAISLVVVTASYTTIGVMNHKIKKEIVAIEQLINDPVIMEKAVEITEALNDIQNIEKYNDALRLATNKLDTMPVFDRSIFNEIAKAMPTDVTITNINYTVGTITLQCQAEKRLSPANMTNALRKSPYLEHVLYTGFASGEEGQLNYKLDLIVRGEAELYAAQ